jgi:ABC-type Mn2+/Zn2+ transport system ATPase subunit
VTAAPTPAPSRPAPPTAGPDPAAAPLLSLHAASLGYGRRAVLQDVSFDIHAGEFWCFLGPNGEGKTTLIKSLLGALRPLRGVVHRRDKMFRAGKVSYVPQRLELNPVLPTSVREFVLSGLAGVRTDAGKRARRLKRVLELVGLGASQKQNYWTLSGGQKQRALVARALVRDPSLLIVDEPTAGLDFAAVEAVLNVMRELYRDFGVTVVFVTHDLNLAAEHATHLAFFRSGKVVAGPKERVLTGERLHATFGVPVSVRRDERGRLRVGDVREAERDSGGPDDRAEAGDGPATDEPADAAGAD